MKRSVRYASLTLTLLAASYAHAKDAPPNFDAYLEAASDAPQAFAPARVGASGGAVASVDEKRGVPTFLWASKDQRRPIGLAAGGSEQLARHYLSANAAAYFPAVEAWPLARFLCWKSPCGLPVHGYTGRSRPFPHP